MSIFEQIQGKEAAHRAYQLRSSVSGEEIGVLECASAAEVQAAVATARRAQPGWAALPIKQRAAVMRKALQVVWDMREEIIDTVVRETGKARTEALTMEVLSSCDSLCYYAKNAPKFLKPRKKRVHGVLGFAKKLRIYYQPLGVVAIITPWNGPFILGMNAAVQALMAGNSVLIKGSEVTPYSTQLVEKVFQKAGLPEGVLQVLMGDGETGAALVEADINKLSFTGSVATGRKVGESCARRLIPFTLELGGKDAMIVCADANLERAAAGAVIGSCMNTGHYCCGTERIYVVDSVYDEFLKKVVDKTAALRQGSRDYEEDVGAVFWDRQMEIIETHVSDAKEKGAEVLVGGERNNKLQGLYYKPTVMTKVDHDMTIMRDETFGPILCIMRVKNEEEALHLANDSHYGLNGNIWTRDNKKAQHLARQMETGAVCINDMALTYGIPAAPFGGRKQSGVGQVNGETGVRNYCHPLPVISERRNSNKIQGAYPYTEKQAQGMLGFIRIFWIKTPLGKWLS